MNIFKPHKYIPVLILIVIVISACFPLGTISSEGNVGNTPPIEEPGNYDESRDLTEHLSKISGVRVLGIGSDARITIRGGQNSFNLSSEPLFVLNNTPINGGYRVLYGIVDVGSIVSIKVIKGADAAMYGSRGSNGVIEIVVR